MASSSELMTQSSSSNSSSSNSTHEEEVCSASEISNDNGLVTSVSTLNHPTDNCNNKCDESSPTLNVDDSVDKPTEIAVLLRDANKSYGKGSGKRVVLDNLNMTVEKGVIYGLLGASGCGKTTVLSCAVGRRTLDNGHVRVFGGVPGDRATGVPGKRIGYMPQELALFAEFTAEETLTYFGRLYGMSRSAIKKEQDFILDFLDLPRNKMIKKMSGGQQRRSSFAVSLFHNPELLILDEPTVGVDPKLRQSIWSHLIKLAHDQHKTIIITTHYIEEARQADVVGLMRHGKLLAEDSPQFLLDKYGSHSLEQVFLQLCSSVDSCDEKASVSVAEQIEKQDEKEKHPHPHQYQNLGFIGINEKTEDQILPLSFKKVSEKNEVEIHQSEREIKMSQITTPTSTPSSCWNNFFVLPSLFIIWALLCKNFLKLKRNYGQQVFIFILPAIQVVFFCVAIGGHPRDIKIGIVNNEFNTYNLDSDNNETVIGFDMRYPLEGIGNNCHVAPGCNTTNLSCRFYDSLFNSQNHSSQPLIPIFYPDESSALHAVRSGQIWGTVSTPANFSKFFIQRLTSSIDVEEKIIEKSRINVSLDYSNQQILFVIQEMLHDRYKEFVDGLLNDCNFPDGAGDLPIVFDEPVYGLKKTSFTEFMAPGIILLIVFFLALSLTGELFISEKIEGLLDRSWIAGVLASEVLIAHSLTQFFIITLQTATTLVFMLVVFDIPCQGPVGWLVGITLLQGTAGMSYGMLISSMFSDMTSSMQLSIGSFYPNLLLSGIVWPLEGMPWFLQQIAWYLPCTAACQAGRDIMSRGWGITEPTVYMGYVSSICWTAFFLIMAMLVLKFKSN